VLILRPYLPDILLQLLLQLLLNPILPLLNNC
jgi:hypothetical protein